MVDNAVDSVVAGCYVIPGSSPPWLYIIELIMWIWDMVMLNRLLIGYNYVSLVINVML